MDFDALEEVFRQDDVENANVAVLSIVGPYRTGKSFLLSLLTHFFREVCVFLNQCKCFKAPSFQRGDAVEPISKCFLTGNRFHVILRNLSP